jgi:hypothetical protein
MPAATTKSGLLTITRDEFSKLDKMIAPLSTEVALHRDSANTCIRDVIAHRAHWIDLFMGWVADGKAGRQVHIPARGYNWGQLRAYNNRVRAEYADMTWSAAQGWLHDQHAELLKLILSMSDAELYGRPMPGQSRWPTGRFAEASGASHYRSAARYVRAQLRAQ